jgi:hypothetical protein
VSRLTVGLLLGLLVLSLVPQGTAPTAGNRPPTAVAGPDQIVPSSPPPPYTASPQIIVNLTATSSWDPDCPDTSCLKDTWTVLNYTAGCPDIAPTFKSNGHLMEKFPSPNISGQGTAKCYYRINVHITDGSLTSDDQVNVTVLHDPAIGSDYLPTFGPKPSIALGLPPSTKPLKTVDIIADHGKNITFTANGVSDDQSVLGVQVFLTAQHNTSHVLFVGLTKVLVTSTNPEVSNWFGKLAVDTPDLVADNGDETYDVTAVAYDNQGGKVTIPAGAYSLEVTAGDAGSPPTIIIPALNNAPALTADPCFPASPPPTNQRVTYALGVGQILTPQITGLIPQDIDVVNDTGPIPDLYRANPLIGLWKVTYQNCIIAADGSAVYGTETALPQPFHMNLDTLFQGNQDVAIRAYDRVNAFSTGITTVVVRLLTDTGPPTFIIVPPANVTYQGVPFHFTAYVHDSVATTVTLHVNEIGRNATTGRHIAYDNRTTAYEPTLVLQDGTLVEPPAFGPHGFEVTLPPLSSMAAVDPRQQHGPCVYLFATGNGAGYNMLFNPADGRAYPLLSSAGATGGTLAYTIDSNRNDIADPGEATIGGKVGSTTQVQGQNQCTPPSLALQSFFGQATQVFTFTLTRTVVNSTGYSITIEDNVFNHFGQEIYVYHGANGVLAASRLAGTLNTFRATSDVQIADVHVAPGPYLPGDHVQVDVLVRQNSTLLPPPCIAVNVTQREAGAGGTYRISNKTTPPLWPANQSPAQTLCANGQPCFVNLQPCISPTEATVSFARPDPAHPLDVGFGPGVHVLFYDAQPPELVSESANDTVNNVGSAHFEVFLGKVVDNRTSPPATYYIRAQGVFAAGGGLPMLTGGAVAVDATGNVTNRYDLKLNLSRYDFTVRSGTNVTHLYWDAQEHHDATTGAACTAGAPNCRAITFVNFSNPSSATRGSPVVSPFVVLVVALTGLALARRRDPAPS